HLSAGPLDVESDADSIVRLDAQRDHVRPQLFLGRGGEERLRRVFEVNANLGDLARQPFAGANKERHARPAPVVHIKLDGDIRLGGGAALYARLLAIAGDVFAAALAGP